MKYYLNKDSEEGETNKNKGLKVSSSNYVNRSQNRVSSQGSYSNKTTKNNFNKDLIKKTSYKATIPSKPKVKKKRKIFKTIRRIILIILVLGIGFGVYEVTNAIVNNKAININPLQLLANQVTHQDPPLNSTNGVVSILLFGGDTRSGSLSYNLEEIGNTDVIMIISYDMKNNVAHLISLPRDMGIKFQFPNNVTYDWNKITSGVYLGESGSYPGGGAQLMRDTIKQMTGITINYTVIVDFNALVQIIDAIGGVDVNVENSFCDAGYPTDQNGKTITVIFQKGLQHLDGTRALEFARSRVHDACANYTSGDPIFEGTDFRRNYRQQQVITAIKNKISKMTITLDTVLGIYNALSNNILTEVGNGEFDPSKRIDLTTIKTAVDNIKTYEKATIDDFVIDPNACGAKVAKEGYIGILYYLIPLQFNFGNLKDCLNFYLNYPGMEREEAVTAVYNTGSAGNLGIAQHVSDEMNANYMAVDFYNTLYTQTAKSADGTKTIDLSNGNFVVDWYSANPVTTAYLSKKYNAKIINKTDVSGTLRYLGGAQILLLIGNPYVSSASSSSSVSSK